MVGRVHAGEVTEGWGEPRRPMPPQSPGEALDAPTERTREGLELSVRHVEGDRFVIDVRGHALVIDQPRSAGGDDTGPTPTELFVASLAACIGFYAERYLVRHGLPGEGLRVGCRFTMSRDRPARVGEVDVTVHVPVGLSESRRAALAAVVEHCTVHNSIRQAPVVRIDLKTEEVAA